MKIIMVSYRRADAADMAGRISDFLIAKYGEKSIFFDVNSIGTGVNYRRRIESAIRDSKVVIAVIGLHWLGQNPNGPARIHDPADPVRVEIETALTQMVPIFPLLVNGAKMPEESELPDALRELHYNNAAKVDSGQDFRMHMTRLVESIDETIGPPDPAITRFGRAPAYAAGGMALLAVLAVLLWSRPNSPVEVDSPNTNTAAPAVTGSLPPPTGLTPQLAALATQAKSGGGFILPGSDQRLIGAEDLKGFSPTQLRLARNEIYARHGRFFVDPTLAMYFSQFSWYHPRQVEVELSPLESTNVSTIQLSERGR